MPEHESGEVEALFSQGSAVSKPDLPFEVLTNIFYSSLPFLHCVDRFASSYILSHGGAVILCLLCSAWLCLLASQV